MESVVEKWTTKVNTITLGATKQMGGTREKTVTVGGSSTLPYLNFEGAWPNPPAIAIEMWDREPDGWPEPLADAYADVWKDPAKWAKRAVEYGAEMLCVTLKGTHPDFGNRSPDEAAGVVKDVLKAVGVPLIIWGSGDFNKDNDVMPRVSEAAKGENCLLGTAVEKNYKTLTASCLADGHKIIGESPLDINIAKQVNILISEMGFKLEDIVIFPATGALGYGMEYSYSIMERGRTAGLSGDRMLAQPVICTVGQESWRVKEARGSEKDFPTWGDLKKRGPLWEATCAATLMQAGGEIVVMRHPDAVKSFKSLLREFTA
ncbi:acetyl-CoA decarbonylase/synthase complex subunit delta [Candidatus Poribacteria bacterium]|nr:acetyl-CoA decarbonylase/synthase complex subunit delta [Candidatus Poribacteria bacterium]